MAVSKKAVPVQAEERIEVVDILRGFAILGILVGNMASYSGMARDPHAYAEPIDRAIILLTRFFVEAKFYSLFSFLFGWGMAVQMARAEARGAPFAPMYARRLLVLLGFGLAHGVFVWSGDILTTYALLGFVLLLFRKRSGIPLLVMAILALSFSIVVTLPGEAMEAFRAWYEGVTGFLRRGTLPHELYATGSYGEITRLRLQEFLGANSWFVYWVGNILGMFFLGLYAGKRRLLHNVDQHTALVRLVLVIGLGMGLVLNGAYVLILARPELVPDDLYRLATRGLRTLGAPAMMLFYVTTIILLVRGATWRNRLLPLASLGRGALSNYLLQSVVCTLLFYGYGLGLYGQIDPLLGLILTVVILLTQIRLSSWWFSVYRFGPAEWVWRSLVYRRFHLERSESTGAGSVTPVLGNLRNNIRQGAGRVDSRILLAGGLLALLSCSTLFIVQNVHQEGALLESSATLMSTSAPARSETDASSAGVALEAAEEHLGGSEEQAVAVVATPVVHPVEYRPGPLAAAGDISALASAFNVEAAMDRIEVLTVAPYLGRYPSSPGGWEAAEYIAIEFSRYGLQPAGKDGTFFQPFPFDYVSLEAEPHLTVATPDGTIHDDYVLFEDYAALAKWYSGTGAAAAPVVWGNGCTREDFSTAMARDKIVLCHATSVMEAERNAVEHGAAGLLLLTAPAERPADFGHTYGEPWIPKPLPVLRVYPSLGEDLLLGSDVSLADLSLGLEPFALETRVEMEVQTEGGEACSASGCQARNVLGVLPGRDPKYADQVIILGAHYDHLGQGPEGTVWAGANDNASGVAVMLEVARTWQEQGYVPRHTVLFAAWDAEEEGLLGSRQYVRAPSYPLESTVAMIQLDMVGAGGDTLWIDGGGEVADRLRVVAEGLGLDAEITGFGRSDHLPFLESDVPASLLIWQFGDGEPRYHRPGDTPDTIQLDKLEAVGRIVGTTILGLTEGEPAIRELLELRAAALESGDLAGFLHTSVPGQESNDHLWFDGVQDLAPRAVIMEAADLRVEGNAATATVRTTLDIPPLGVGESPEAHGFSLSVKFQHGANGWRWAGPDLAWVAEGAGFAVAGPPDVVASGGLEGVGDLAARRYAENAALLGLPPDPDATLLVLPDGESLRASTSPMLGPGQDTWVGNGTVKLAHSHEITASETLTMALTHLLLTEAGVPEVAVPWLWQGLPLALNGRKDQISWQSRALPELQRVLAAGPAPAEGVAAWAAVDYLREQVGWHGVGAFIARLGETCSEGECLGSQRGDRVFGELLHTDEASFENAWRAHWDARMARTQAELDALLEARAAAVLAGDESSLLGTVDPVIPYLRAEEQHWLKEVRRAPLAGYVLSGSLKAFLDDGSILADVTEEYRLDPAAGSVTTAGDAPGEWKVTRRVLFTPDGSGYVWAGTPLRTLRRDKVQILYPEGQKDLAAELLVEAGTAYEGLARTLGIGDAAEATIKLFDSADAYQISITPSFGSRELPPGWSEAGASIKLLSAPGTAREELRSTLVRQLVRHLLQGVGVTEECLLRGVGTYLSSSYDGGVGRQVAARGLRDLQQAVIDGKHHNLSEMPRAEETSGQEREMLEAQAWDAVQYLVSNYGWEALTSVLTGRAAGQDLDTALQTATGQTVAQFQVAWSASLSRAHARPEWVETAERFDPDRAAAHVAYLASPELEGRLAGTPGAENAATYIAAAFEEAGLQPVGDQWRGGGRAFYQTVPFTQTVLLSAPMLEVVGGLDGTTSFVYRQDHVLPLGAAVASGRATGDLIWFDDNYGTVDLAGKIVLRHPSHDLDTEVALATNHGAGGLILIGNRESSRELLAKTVFRERPEGQAIPTLELTPAGFDRLKQMAGSDLAGKLETSQVLPLSMAARIAVSASEAEATETLNVLGLLPGSDPALAQEVLVLGAHYDHVGDDPDLLLCSGKEAQAGGHVSDAACLWEEGRRYAGANDNASGVGVLLEIARLWRESDYRPKRSVLFAAWGAQEQGEAGSRYYVDNPSLPLQDTMAAVMLDSVGGGRGYYLEAQGAGEREEVLLASLQMADELVNGRLALRTRAGESDQVPFREAGVPALLLSWRDASDANWPVEIAEEVDPYRLGVTGRVVGLALMSLAQ